MKKPIVHRFYKFLYVVYALLLFPCVLLGMEVTSDDPRIQSPLMEYYERDTNPLFCNAFPSPVPGHAEKLCMLEVFRAEIFMRELFIANSAPLTRRALEKYCKEMGRDCSSDETIRTMYLTGEKPIAQFFAKDYLTSVTVMSQEAVRFDRQAGVSQIKNLVITWDKFEARVSDVSFYLTRTVVPSETQRHAEEVCIKYLKQRMSGEDLDEFLLRLIKAFVPDWIVFFVRCMPNLVDKLNFEKPSEDNSTDEEASDDDETW